MNSVVKHDIDFLAETGQLEDLAHYLANYGREEHQDATEVIRYALEKVKGVATDGGTTEG